MNEERKAPFSQNFAPFLALKMDEEGVTIKSTKELIKKKDQIDEEIESIEVIEFFPLLHHNPPFLILFFFRGRSFGLVFSFSFLFFSFLCFALLCFALLCFALLCFVSLSLINSLSSFPRWNGAEGGVS